MGYAVQIITSSVVKGPFCRFTAAFAIIGLMSSAAFAQEPGASLDPTGEWLVSKQLARIRIVDCNDRIWGIVSWEARAGVDKNNPDHRLRTRPTLGMPILLGMTHAKSNRWEGQIYNSEDGRTYDASISLLDQNTLKVQGCVLGFLCGGENWSRVGPPDATSAEQQAPSTGQAANRTGKSQTANSQTTKTPKAKPPNANRSAAPSPAASPSTGKPPVANNPTPAEPVTPETVASEPAAAICSRVAGLPGLAH